jgi:hypothetical protein
MWVLGVFVFVAQPIALYLAYRAGKDERQL